MKKFFTVLLFTLLTHFAVKAQYLVGFHFDAYKTDNRKPVEFIDKAQFGVEANYFLLTQLAMTAGVEYWTEGGLKFVPGMRIYPIQTAFLRFRPLLGKEVDYAFGAGYARRITDFWRLEVMTDYYFEISNVALRFGVAYTL